MMIEPGGEWLLIACAELDGAGGGGASPAASQQRLFNDAGLAAPAAPQSAASLVPCDAMRLDAAELRLLGDEAAAARALDRALAWYLACPDPERHQHRADHARTLYEAERWEEASQGFEALAAEQPENICYLGHLGTLAARRGDRAEAGRMSRLLACTRQRYLFGAHTLWRARIAAQLGQRRQALRLLQEALAQGQPNGVWLLLDPDLAPLRGSRVFRRLIRGTRLAAAPRRGW
jgi:predicted Zn-dependent protease